MTAVRPVAALRSASVRPLTASELMAGSRLHLPGVASQHLPRKRLSELLESSAAPLVLVSAPAGSGKSALAAEWAHRLKGARQVVWVRCHGSDLDPWADVLRGMGSEQVPEARRVERVIESVGGSSVPWVVFLDGHEIRSARAAEDLARLLTYTGVGLQVVLTTRADPVLPLHRYRLDGTLLEVRAADLAFTDAEAQELLGAGGVQLDSTALHALNTRLAGWAAGLRFALPALAGHRAPEGLVSRAVTHNGNINAYLVEEVLGAQPPRLRELVLATSVADTLTPDLLEELTGEPAAPTALRLVRANVFLESAAGDPACLHYVPFFRDLVQAQLAMESPETFRELHRKVAAWAAADGRWDDVVRHLERAGERSDCGALLLDHLLVGRVLCERRDETFRRLVAASPSHRVAGRCEDHLLAAATALADGDTREASTHLEAARRAGPIRAGADVTTAVLEAVHAGMAADPAHAEELAARAEEALDARPHPLAPWADDVAAVLRLVRARAALRLGSVTRAERLLETALASRTATWSTTYRALCLAHAAVLHARAGAPSRAVDEADRAVAAAGAGSPESMTATTAHVARACASVATGELDSAAAHLAQATTPTEPLWQVVHAVVAAALDRSAGEQASAAGRLDAVAAVAASAGPWLASWVDEERAQLPREDVPRLHVPVAVVAPQEGRPGPVPTGRDGRVVEPLTPREVEVLAAIDEWLTTEEVADKLFVSVNTVRTHVRSILAKLGVTRRSAAVREARRLGLLASGNHVDPAAAPTGAT